MGVVCLRHLLENLFLFASGRVLLAVFDRLGLDAAMRSHVELISHWYELGLFLMFSVSCGLQLALSRWRELRGAVR